MAVVEILYWQDTGRLRPCRGLVGRVRPPGSQGPGQVRRTSGSLPHSDTRPATVADILPMDCMARARRRHRPISSALFLSRSNHHLPFPDSEKIQVIRGRISFHRAKERGIPSTRHARRHEKRTLAPQADTTNQPPGCRKAHAREATAIAKKWSNGLAILDGIIGDDAELHCELERERERLDIAQVIYDAQDGCWTDAGRIGSAGRSRLRSR